MTIRQGFLLCGLLSEHRPPTETLPGSITVAGEQYILPADVEQNVWEGARVGTNACVRGTYVDRPAGRTLVGDMTLGGP